MNLLPGEPRRNARNPGGIRLGVQEMTRFKMGEDAMDRIAELIRAALFDGKSLADECARLRGDYPEIHYGYTLDRLHADASS